MKLRSFGLVCVLMGALSFAGSAKAQSDFNIYLYQDGSNVVASGSGDFDLDGLNFLETAGILIRIQPSFGGITFGIPVPGDKGGAPIDLYTGITGPSSFGPSNGVFRPSSTTGDGFGVAGFGVGSGGFLYVPVDYDPGTSLAGTMTFDGTTLSGLGVTTGTYTWTWGDSGENSLTLHAGVSPVPEPSQYGLFVFLALLGLIGWRRLKVHAA